MQFCFICIATLLFVIDGGQSAAQGKPKPLVKAPEGAITTGHHIVVLREDTSKSDLHNVIEKVKRMSEDVVVHRYTEHVGKTLTVNAPDHVMEKIRYFNEVSHIEEEDVVSGATEKPTIHSMTNNSVEYLWFLDRLNQPNLPLDKIFKHTSNTNEESVDVYVLDSGIEFDHSEFEHRAKYAGYDPMDEYHSTTVNIPDYEPQRGRDCNGHGTLVASLIGGKTFGTAKKVNLFSVRVLDCQLSGATSVILDGLNFIANEVSERNRPAIISMALRGTKHTSLDTAINTLYSKNVLIVGSVGNIHSDSCSYFPGSNSRVLRVGASTANDTIYEKSNYGRCVDLFAPGEHIRGADPSCPTCTTGDVSGTSLASALVCGIAAVHLSQLPLMKPSGLKQRVISVSSKDVLNVSFVPTTPNRLANFDCGGTFLIPSSTQEVVLTSPNFPKHYLNSSLCSWTVYAPKGMFVYVDFSYIKIERTYDWLEVCSGEVCSKNSLITKLSGDYGETSCGYYSSTNTLTLELHTDKTTTSAGFKVKGMVARKRPSRGIKECSDYKKDQVTALQLDAVSQGTNHGNRFSMSINWEEVFGGRRQGFNIAIIDEVSGRIKFTQNYDTYFSSTQSINLAKKIEGLPPGVLVILSSSGYASRYFDTRAKRAISTLGSVYSYSMNSASSWALVGIKGLARGRAIEYLDHNAAVRVSTQVKLQTSKQYGPGITVMSSGNNNGADASIIFNEKEVEILNKGGTKIGLNVAVFNEDSGRVLETRVFNTHTEVVADYSPSKAFADFIDDLPAGRIVAIAIRGDAVTHLTEEAKLACEKIGSRLIRNIRIDRSWAIVGRKGALPGEVAETMKYNGRSWASYFFPVNNTNKNISCKISAASITQTTGCSYSGYFGTYISIANNTFPSNLCPSPYGITVGLVDEHSCQFEQTKVFGTHGSSSQDSLLVSFINSADKGRIIVATIGYDAIYRLDSNAKRALERIGSAHIQNVATYQAWAIIGRKGAAPGSVPEAYHADYTAAISATVPLTVPDLPSVSSCEDSLYPLNCRAGMSA